ncbi:hypothetical protein VDG1235_3606 [Verrucomicrobiia bacterium DG1235]|nr:hypothetical protein VDG1235_3606 [Verrucomicrobiae bacterium DG1235]
MQAFGHRKASDKSERKQVELGIPMTDTFLNKLRKDQEC